MEKATFGAGCFWGVEASFRKMKGVVSTRVGYAGGHVPSPSYEKVCSDTTGHVEVVEVIFDPKQVTYQQLLECFWKIHNPTTRNRQGPDRGSQYRSVVFFHNPEQELLAIESKRTAQNSYREPIVTEILPVSPFYQAEEYHQQYHEKHGGECRL